MRAALARTCGCLAIAAAAGATPTGLNTIPTTDIVPFHSMVAQLQNGNLSTDSPAFYKHPDVIVQTQLAVAPRIEAGIDWIQPPDLGHKVPTFNIKDSLFDEDDTRPGIAVGLWNVTPGQVVGSYVTLSKTLNYDQEQRERFRAHHRRNRKLLGRRVHAGLIFDGRSAYTPFLGTDIQLSESAVFQADWISGSGNALSFGGAYVLSDQKTVLSAAFLVANGTQRVNGFFLNIGREFNW